MPRGGRSIILGEKDRPAPGAFSKLERGLIKNKIKIGAPGHSQDFWGSPAVFGVFGGGGLVHSEGGINKGSYGTVLALNLPATAWRRA